MGVQKLGLLSARPTTLSRSRSDFGTSSSPGAFTSEELTPKDSRHTQFTPQTEFTTVGSQLSITVPAASVSADKAFDEDNKTSSEQPGNRILLVDDNNINLRVLSACMRKLHHAYETATNGREVVDQYIQGAGRFTAILIDLNADYEWSRSYETNPVL